MRSGPVEHVDGDAEREFALGLGRVGRGEHLRRGFGFGLGSGFWAGFGLGWVWAGFGLGLGWVWAGCGSGWCGCGVVWAGVWLGLAWLGWARTKASTSFCAAWRWPSLVTASP